MLAPLAWRDLCPDLWEFRIRHPTRGRPRAGAFVFCCDCGEAYHGACAACPPNLPNWALATWRCPNCKLMQKLVASVKTMMKQLHWSTATAATRPTTSIVWIRL